jgi:hypothetical protein
VLVENLPRTFFYLMLLYDRPGEFDALGKVLIAAMISVEVEWRCTFSEIVFI